MVAGGSIAKELLDKINKYPFTPLPLHLPHEYVVPAEDFECKTLPADHWIDLRKIKSKNRVLPSGIF